MSNFHDIRFPMALSRGSAGGPERRTEIIALRNGYEERNSPWAQSRRRYDAGLALRSLDDLETVIAFFEARHGQLYAFRWRDGTDWKSCKPSLTPAFDDQIIGIGDGQRRAFTLAKTYRSGAQSFRRLITKPVPETISIGLGGIEATLGQGVSVDPLTGLVVFDDPPAEEAEITAGFEFDVPVRFDTDWLEISATTFFAGEVPHIPVVEVRA